MSHHARSIADRCASRGSGFAHWKRNRRKWGWRYLARLIILTWASVASADSGGDESGSEGSGFGDPWTAADTFVEAGVALTLAADFLQTRQICADMRAGTNADWVRETNPLMGSSCQRLAPELYFPLALGAHVLAARLLPQPYRRVFQGLTIVVQADAIGRNMSAGYSISW